MSLYIVLLWPIQNNKRIQDNACILYEMHTFEYNCSVRSFFDPAAYSSVFICFQAPHEALRGNMLCQILNDKTVDVGKLYIDSVDRVCGYPLMINTCDEFGADSKNDPEFLRGQKSDYLSPITDGYN